MNSQADVYALLNKMEKDHWWQKSRRAIIEKLFWHQFGHHIPHNPKILSVGCSTGVEINFLKQFGDVTAIDIEDEAIEYCRQRGLNVVKEDITENNLAANSYDIIFAMDVIEHIPDHEKAIAEIHRLLKPNGFAVFTVPALMMLWSSFDELSNAPHQRRYHKPDLRNLLQDFNIKKISYYNFFLFPLVFFVRKLNLNPKKQLEVPPRLVNKILFHVFSNEKHFLKHTNFPWGSSLISIAQKQ